MTICGEFFLQIKRYLNCLILKKLMLGGGIKHFLNSPQMTNENSEVQPFTLSYLSKRNQKMMIQAYIRCIIFEQKKPENDDTSLYQVFERINTSGRTLTAQEIRNCI